MRPGVTTIWHSSGCTLSHDPRSAHAKRHATVLAELALGSSATRKGERDADSDAPRVTSLVERGAGGRGRDRAVGLTGPCRLKSFSSPNTETAQSSSDSEVIDSPSSWSEYSLPDGDSEAVDGSYSCFSGDDVRLCCCMNAGVKDGIACVPAFVGVVCVPADAGWSVSLD